MAVERSVRLPDIQSYTARDFSAIRAELENWVMLNKPDLWSDFFESNLGEFLIQLIAYHGDLLSFAIDRMGEETFLASCRLYKSGLKHAQLLAYKPFAATAASVDVRVSPLPNDIATYGVHVDEGTSIQLGNNLTFEVAQEYDFPAGSTEMILSMREGITTIEEFESSGDGWIELTTDATKVIEGSWHVYVDTVEWTEVDFVALVPSPSQVYAVTFEGDRSLTVRFGDGVTGAIPPQGSTIQIKFRVGGGTQGNVPARSILTSLPAIQNGKPINMQIVNDFSASGGSERESLEHIKRWAPLNVKTVDKCITRFDYEVESASFADPALGAIAKASAKLRVGTLAVPNPGPADYTVIEEFTTATDNTLVESLGNQSGVYNDRVAFSFTIPANNDVSRISFYTKKIGLPGAISMRIETDNAGLPSGVLADVDAFADFSESVIYGTGWIRVRLNNQVSLTSATTYWCVLTLGSDPTVGHYYEIYGDSGGGYPNGKFMYYPMNLADAFTKLLLHCNGPEDSTLFLDSGVTGHAVTAHGNARVRTEHPMFGDGAAYFDGASSYLSVADSLDFLWSADFTFECFVRFSGVNGTMNIFAHGDDSASKFSLRRNHNLNRWELEIGGNTYYYTSVVLNATYYHLEISRSAGNVRLFQNGVALGSVVADATVIDPGSNGIYVGGDYNHTNYMVGYLDEIRISQGIARHSANFTPPTQEFGGIWVDGTEITDAAFRVEIGGPHVVHADDPIFFDSIEYKAKSQFEITGNNVAIFIDPNTVDIYVWAITTDSEGRQTYGPVSSALKASLLNHLDVRAVVCTISFIHDGGLVPVDLNLGDVYVDPSYDLSVVQASIYDAIEEFFMDDTIEPGTSFLLSDFYNKIEDVEGILHFVERLHYGDIDVSDTEMIVRGAIAFTCVHPPIEILRDITARY